MSWEAAVLILLGISLLSGALWYERSRPPSQVVALVAALAALAAAGRVALSPIPNVVPTTDITLIAGYALGGPAGFAVGSLAALASNFWLGQGPWTPWQMAGWGIAGLVGAALAATTGRRLGRVGLAVACGVAGLVFGALMDLSLMVTYGGEQSLDRYLAISARSIPFNAAHVAGNVALALVAGPALVRMLTRYRRRFEFAWNGRGTATRRSAAAGAACLLLAVLLAGTAAPPPAASGAGKASAVSWLRAAQNSDGGFASDADGDSTPGMTGWAVLALEAAGRHPSAIRNGGSSALDYLRETASEISTTGDIERTILVLDAAGLNPAAFEGRDLVGRLVARRSGNGSWNGQVNPTAFGVLALDAAGRASGNSRSAAWLRSTQNSDGGWGFIDDTASDPDSTGAVLQALAAAGGSSGAIRSGVTYLRGAQRDGGGFALSGGQVNAQSTAWAVQGLVAAGVSPGGVKSGGRSPLSYLSSVQAGDGHYRYSRSSDQTPVWVTGQALLATTRSPFPLPVVSASSGSAASSSGSSGSPSGAGTAATGADAGTGGAGPEGASGAAGAAGGVAGAEAESEASSGVPAEAENSVSTSYSTGDGDSTLLWAALGALGAIALAAWLYSARNREPEV